MISTIPTKKQNDLTVKLAFYGPSIVIKDPDVVLTYVVASCLILFSPSEHNEASQPLQNFVNDASIRAKVKAAITTNIVAQNFEPEDVDVVPSPSPPSLTVRSVEENR